MRARPDQQLTASIHPLLRLDLGTLNFDRLPSIHSAAHVHYLGTIAQIAAIVAAAASVSATAYSAVQGGPKMPNLGSSSRQVAQAQANALPWQRQLAAAEQQGGTADVHVARHREKVPMIRMNADEAGQLDRAAWDAAVSEGGVLPGSDALGLHFSDFMGLTDDSQQYTYIPYKAEDWAPGGKFYKPGRSDDWLQKHTVQRGMTIKAHDQPYDFSGYGTADIQGDLARQMADIQTRLGEKYGTQFAEEARKEAEQADPQGFAARAKELELIQKGIDNPMPINPLATELDSRMKSRIDAGSGLDSMSRDLLDSAIARSNADRAGGTSSEDVAHQLSTGMEGQARRQAGLRQGQAWLSSGATPEDVQYRREMQNLSNLGSFVSGQTPESQFANLSGAGQGATPFYPGQSGPQMPGNAAQVGSGYGVSSYLAQLRAQGSQANPWFAGLSSLLSGIGGFANSGTSGYANPNQPWFSGAQYASNVG